MKFRDYYFKREDSVADSDTVIIDLKGKGAISYITVEMEATNGSTSCTDHEIHDDVSLIEVVDGGKVIASLSMEQWLAINSLLLKRIPHQLLSEVGGAKQEERIMILFGRYPNDPNYYLDVGMFKNPELRVNVGLTISSTAGFATGTGKITVMGRIFEETPGEYKGFMRYREIRRFTSASSGDEPIRMPTNYPIRLIGVQTNYSGYRPDEIISKVKVSCNNDEFVPINNYTEDLIDMNQEVFGKFEQQKTILRADDATVKTDIWDIRDGHIRPNADDHIATIESVDAEKVSIGLYDMTSPATPAFQTSAKQNTLTVLGMCPFGVVGIPFGDINNPDEWLQAQNYERVDIYLTQATANATVYVLVIEVPTSLP